jgi:hypothetical protein
MTKSDKVLLWIAGIVFALALVLLGARVVMAEDDEIGFCTNKNAVNYIGAETINLYKDSGYRVVDDGSCYCLKVEMDSEGNVLSADETSCKNNDTSYYDWLGDPDALYNAQFTPAYYGKLIDIGGCTDPLAYNWMDPQWWQDYNIIDDGSCEYLEAVPELPEVITGPENAL